MGGEPTQPLLPVWPPEHPQPGDRETRAPAAWGAGQYSVTVGGARPMGWTDQETEETQEEDHHN